MGRGRRGFFTNQLPLEAKVTWNSKPSIMY
jgi:hypothetical protein